MRLPAALVVALLPFSAAAQSLGTSGDCPGPVALSAGGLSPGGPVALLSANGPGSFVVPAGGCAGTVTGLSPSGATLRALGSADVAGNWSMTPTIPAVACSASVQVVDLASCATTPIAGLRPPPWPYSFGEIVGFADASYAEDLAVAHERAYLCSKSDGLRVFDVATPSSPALTDTLDKGADEAWDIVVQGELAVVAWRGAGVVLLDLADPSHPAEIGSWYGGFSVDAVAVDGTTVYASGGDGIDGRVVALDISTPGAISLLDSLMVSGEAVISLARSGTTLYGGGGHGMLFTIDASDPSALSQTSSYYTDVHGEPWGLGVFVHGDLLYYANWGAGISILDISSPLSPSELTAYKPASYAYYDIWADDTRAYVATDGNLAVLDVTDPTSPSVVEWLDLKIDWSDGNHGVAVVGSAAYVADNKSAKLVVVSIEE